MSRFLPSVTLATIDIGSNAVRMLVGEVSSISGQLVFRKVQLLRLPIRLGEDVFVSKHISLKKTQMLIKAFQTFKHLIDIHEIDHYKAIATSAMRNAENGRTVVANIYNHTGIEVDIISGQEEASVLFDHEQLTSSLQERSEVIYMDVGGGSTELNYIVNGQSVDSKSFPIGTVRMLLDYPLENVWADIKYWCKTKSVNEIIAVGGNINKIHKLNRLSSKEVLPVDLLDRMYTEFSQLSVEQLVLKYKLKRDRADVIVHAQKLYLQVAKWVSAAHFIVPKIGLADATMRKLYNDLYRK